MNGATIGILVAAVIVAGGYLVGHHYGLSVEKACSTITKTVGQSH
jgi:hypothetical protein